MTPVKWPSLLLAYISYCAHFCMYVMCVQLFNLSKSEALATDPQQRLLLEETHAALLDGQPATGPLFGTETGV